MVMRREWPKERVEELKIRWANGETCSEIARAMPGTTRCSVIGKVHRLGLPLRPLRGHAIKASRAPVKKIIPPVAPKPNVPQAEPLHIGIMDVTDKTCRFAFGVAAPFTFCGHPPKPGSPYCPDCCKRVYQPQQPIMRDRKEVAEAERLTGINRIWG